MNRPHTHFEEKMGSGKFSSTDDDFHETISSIVEREPAREELIHHFPVFTGHVNLARHLMLYELYKKTENLAGNIADVGVWKGKSMFFFAKLVKTFEPYSKTQVHGFDWFEGMDPDPEKDSDTWTGMYDSDEERIVELIKEQSLQNFTILHNMDLTEHLQEFFNEHPYIRFKLVFIDCGISDVLESSIKPFFEHMPPGGILVLDHYNAKESPTESDHLEAVIGDRKIKQFDTVRSPTGYVIK